MYIDPTRPPFSYLMDSVFSLKAEARSSFLSGVARVLGCVYICLWSYIPHPANCLVSMDGWLDGEDTQQPGSSSGTHRQRLFDLYRRSFCSVETGCVPGLAYKDGLGYLEVQEPKIMSLAATPSQRQFYQEAGIKTAVFMGSRSGEIELGLPTTSNINTEVCIRSMFSEEFVQQSQLGDLFLPDQRPSSSSSSLHSLSVGSPEYSSLMMSKANTSSYMPADTTPREASTDQLATRATAAASVPPHQMTMQAYGRSRSIQFPTPAGDEAAMANAILAVISSSSSSSSVHRVAPQNLAQQVIQGSRREGAFKTYNPVLVPRIEPRHSSHSQRMIKGAVCILRQVRSMNAYGRCQETHPTSNQLHHMISERKRREKINESFAALRMLLPPGTKKDKASVLARAKEYVNSLKAQISDLEERNRLMETRRLAADEAVEEAAEPGERARIQVLRAAESSSETERIELRVTVWEECDTRDLVLPILERLKEMGNTSLVSLDAHGYFGQMNPIRRAIFTLQIQREGWDEEAFKEAIARAVDEAVLAPQPAASAAP